jgi:hypothetical protein
MGEEGGEEKKNTKAFVLSHCHRVTVQNILRNFSIEKETT